MANFIKKLFGSRKKEPATTGEIPTVPRATNLDLAEPQEVKTSLNELPQYRVGIAQSVGKQRAHNEDALFALTSYIAGLQGFIPFGLYIVADGMGGHQHGEVASGLAVRTIANHIIRKLFLTTLSMKPAQLEDSIQEIMQDSVQKAHELIIKESAGSGTTLTAMLILNQQMTIAHVGDSRAYAISKDNEVNVLTRDHSLVMRMIELGQLTTEEAGQHPQRNVLYRALGQGDVPSADVSTYPLPDSGYILLCSDGLWGVVKQDEILRIISEEPNPEDAAQKLIDAANAAGGPDNITGILIRLPG